MSTLPLAEYQGALRDATSRLAAVDESHDLTVASCPGWTVSRLKVHVGRIHRWVAVALTTPDGRDVPAVARPPSDADLAVWLTEGAEHLLAAFTEAGPNGAVRSPGWEQPAWWWLRRCTHETVMHLWDAEEAVGVPHPIPVGLACDGIGELVEVFIPTRFAHDTFGKPATIKVVCADAPSPVTWTVPVGQALPHANGSDPAMESVKITGGASDLLLMLWNRVGAQRLDVTGDTEVLDRYRRSCEF